MQLRSHNRTVPPASRKRKSDGALVSDLPQNPPVKIAAAISQIEVIINDPGTAAPDTAVSGYPPKRKKTKYAHAPGTTPFPDYPHPSPQECNDVKRLLVSVHGESVRPSKLEISNSVSGCGEVPQVLDALMRTILSANTSSTNSARAFKGLVETFGLVEEKKIETEEKGGVKREVEEGGEGGEEPLAISATERMKEIGVGSVDWEAVRRAPRSALYEAIKHGGLADIKSKSMKAILDQVWQEGKERIRKRRAEAGFPDPEPEHEEGELSLEYLKDLDDEVVKAKLTSYKGVGQKTASCVLLFCLQRESFAVDTHVFRLSKLLGWVPGNATRETAFYHLDTRIPNELKYPLHNLFIRHGRTCKHCKGSKYQTNVTTFKPSKKRKESLKEEDTEEDGSHMKVKRAKKIWVGNGMMKEVLVETNVEDDGDLEEDRCVLEEWIHRVRTERRTKNH